MVAIIISGFWGWRFYSSPQYSLDQIRKAVKNHDITQFEKYVDLDSVTARLINRLPSILQNISDEKLFLGSEEINRMPLSLKKDSISKALRESVRAYIERSEWNFSVYTQGPLAKVIGKIPLGSFSVKGIQNVKREGKICKALINIYVQEYDGDATLEIMMRDKGSYWQVVELSNLPQFVGQIAVLQDAFRHKNRFAALLYLANVIDNKREKVIALRSISEALAKSGDVEKAILIANSIDGKGQKAWALQSISEVLVKSGDIEQAITTANSIHLKSAKVEAFRGIAEATAQFGDIEKAKKLFSQAIATANSINDQTVKVSALTVIAESITEIGDIEKAFFTSPRHS